MTRIYHTWDKWECYPAGFFEVNAPKEMDEEMCLDKYSILLKDIAEFKRIMRLILQEWPNSCEHNLTNDRMNRIAWMGQASLCYKYAIPARFRGGYNLLTDEEKFLADSAALEIINEWMTNNNYAQLDSLKPKTEVNLY